MVGPSAARSAAGPSAAGPVSSSSRPSRAAALAARLAAQAAGAAQARLEVTVRGGRNVTRRPAHSLAAPFPPPLQAPAPAPPATASGARGSRPPSASSLQPAPPQQPPQAPPQTLSTAVAFRHLDDARTWVESDVCAGASPEWNVSSCVALNVSPALLARMQARPLRIQVREVFGSTEVALAFHAAQSQAHAALHVAPASPATSPRGKSPRGSISSSNGTKSPRGGVEAPSAPVASASASAAGVSMGPALASLDSECAAEDGEDSRPGIPLGEVLVSLSPLLHGADTIEGWFPLEAPASMAPPAAFFAPDPDLGLPETFVPFALHQSQQPQQTAPNASQPQGAGRPSAPSTPEKGAKRSTSSGRDSKRDTATAAAGAASASEAEALQTAATPSAPPPPMEVWVSIKLSRALLSAADAAACTVLHLDVDRLSSLPARWLADVNELDAEKARTRAEAEAHIATWRKKGSKKAAPPPQPPAAAAKSSSSSSAGAGAGAGGSGGGGGKTGAPASAGAKKSNDKERAREAELRATGERLNSFYRFGYALQVPLEEGAAPFVVSGACDRLELPPEPPQSPPANAAAAGEELSSSSLELGAGRRSVAPTPLGSPTNASKSLASGAGGGGAGAGAGAGAGGATGATSKGRAKKELEERLAREMAEAAEAAHAQMQQRLACRFVPFESRHSLFLTGGTVALLRALAERGESLPLTLWRELVSLDPATSAAGGAVLARDEVVAGCAGLDLRALLKPASTSFGAELTVKLSPEVVAAQQAEAERIEQQRATQAAAAAAGDGGVAGDEGATASSSSSSSSDEKLSRRASALPSSSGSASAAAGASKKSARKTGGAGGKDDGASSASSSAPAGSAPPLGDPFTSARTLLSVRVSLSRPLVALVVKPLLSLGDIVPPRRAVPPPRPSPAVALSEELAAFLAQLAVEYRALLAQAAAEQEENGPLSPEDLEASLAASLLYRLNSSGMFHALKERLKPPMMQLAAAARRELFVHAPAETASQETTFEQRCSALYADMVDRMHLTLGELFHPAAHAAPTTLSPRVALPPPLQLQPDAPYEQQVHVGAPATLLRSITRARVQAEMGSEGPHASSRLAVMAQEAELQDDFPRAALLHHTRCLLEYRAEAAAAATGGSSPSSAAAAALVVNAAETASHWYDFACFQLRLQHPLAAQQALRHALSIDPTHGASMLALAAWSLELRRDLDAAEVLLRTYAERRKGSEMDVQFFVMRGVYAEMIDEPEQAAEAFARAAELAAPNGGVTGGVDGVVSLPSSPSGAAAASHALAEADVALAIPGTHAPALIALPEDFKSAPTTKTAAAASSDGAVVVVDSVWMRVARYFLALCLPGLAAHVLGKESLVSSPCFHAHLARLALVRLGSSPVDTPVELHRVREAEVHIGRAQEAALDHGQVVETFAMRGHVLYQQGRWDEARRDYEVYQDWEPSTLDPLLLYRLGSLYSRAGEWSSAREVFLQLCSCAPSCSSWLGVACAALELGESDAGEAALVQANLLDKSHAGVWARLALVSLRNNRLQLAHQSLLHALRLGCDEAALLVQIAELYAGKGYVDLAVSTLERALALQDSAPVRMQLARTLLLQQRIEQAEQHLQHAVTIAQDEETRMDAQQQWLAVQKQLGRTSGNEQQQQQQQQQSQQHQQEEQNYEDAQAIDAPMVAV